MKIHVRIFKPDLRSHGINIPWKRAWQPIPVFLPGGSPWTEEPGGLHTVHRVTGNGIQLKLVSTHACTLLILTIQKNRRGQCYHRLLPGFEEKMQVSPSHPVHIQNLKESQFQLLVSFHLLSLKLSNQVSNEASTLLYHSTTSCQAFLAEKTPFVCDIKKYKPSFMLQWL